jgi:hypothetical protein
MGPAAVRKLTTRLIIGLKQELLEVHTAETCRMSSQRARILTTRPISPCPATALNRQSKSMINHHHLTNR